MVLQLHDTLQMIHHGYNSIEKGKKTRKQANLKTNHFERVNWLHTLQHAFISFPCLCV